MPIDTPSPPEAKGEVKRPYDPQVYFKEVVRKKRSDRESVRRGGSISSDLGKNMLGVLREKNENNPEALDQLVGRIIKTKNEEQVRKEKEALLRGEFIFIMNREILTDMALDEEGNITDPEITKAYIDDKREKIRVNIEELRRGIEENKRKVEVSQTRLEQWNKLLELAETGLDNETQAQVVAAEGVITDINGLKYKAKEAVERAKQSEEEAEGDRKKIESLTKEAGRLEKIKANIQ